MAEVAVACGTQAVSSNVGGPGMNAKSDEEKQWQHWYGKGFLHLVMEIPVSENQCEEFGFWCVSEGFLQGVSMLHTSIFEKMRMTHYCTCFGTGVHAFRKHILMVQGRGRCPSAPVVRGVP